MKVNSENARPHHKGPIFDGLRFFLQMKGRLVLFLLFALTAFGARGDAGLDEKEFPEMWMFPVFSGRENVYGPQASLWTVNMNLYGVQISPILGFSDKMNGVQIAIGGNIANGVRGLQIGIFNEATESLYGAQVGIVNMVCRYCSRTEGVFVQLGLINLACDKYGRDAETVRILPILRIGW